MTTPAPGEVRVSPDGNVLAWYRPEDVDDTRPWVTLAVDSDPDLDPDWECYSHDQVDGWRVVGATEDGDQT